jgi:hypothetical protein
LKTLKSLNSEYNVENQYDLSVDYEEFPNKGSPKKNGVNMIEEDEQSET